MSSPNLLSERIDFLRGAFSVQVLVAHALGQALLHPASYDKSDSLIRILKSTLGLGYLGVTGFFILSGYCIHLSLRSNVRKGGLSKNTWQPGPPVSCPCSSWGFWWRLSVKSRCVV